MQKLLFMFRVAIRGSLVGHSVGGQVFSRRSPVSRVPP